MDLRFSESNGEIGRSARLLELPCVPKERVFVRFGMPLSFLSSYLNTYKIGHPERCRFRMGCVSCVVWVAALIGSLAPAN